MNKLVPASLASLETALEHKLLKDPQPTAIMAGHQILRGDEYSDVMGVFPEETLKIASKLIMTCRAQLERIEFFALINDWQEETRDDDRDDFWAGFSTDLFPPELEPHLMEGMNHRGGSAIGVVSEKFLQKSFNRLSHQKRRTITKFTAEEAANLAVGTSCHIGGCASEIIMITTELIRRGFKQSLMLIPNVCRQPVTIGAKRVAQRLNVLLPDQKEAFRLLLVFLNSDAPRSEQELLKDASWSEHIIGEQCVTHDSRSTPLGFCNQRASDNNSPQ